MHSGTPEIEPFFQIRKTEKLSIPVMQDLMPSFAIDIFGPSGACQNEELPHLTSSDSITSTTSTPISQASTRGSTTTNQSIISQAPQISTAPQSAK